MKLTRLSLLLLALVVSVLAVPEAFGAKKGGSLSPGGSSETNAAMMCEWFDIYCNGVWADECCGTVNGCLVTCVDVCGGPCIYIE